MLYGWRASATSMFSLPGILPLSLEMLALLLKSFERWGWLRVLFGWWGSSWSSR